MCVCVCVYSFSLRPDEVFLSVRGNRPEQRSSNDGYHCTNRSSDAFCFSHTYFASLSLIHLSLPFFPPPLPIPSLTPPFQRCGTQTETNHRFNEIKLRERPAGGAFVSGLLTAAAVAHLSHLTDSTARDDSSEESSQHNRLFTHGKLHPAHPESSRSLHEHPGI